MNVILVLTDDEAPDVTPKMGFLSAGMGGGTLLLDRARVERSICASSRATVLTGFSAPHHGVWWDGIANSTNPHSPTVWDANGGQTSALPVWLKAVGATTALFGKSMNSHPYMRGDAYVPPGWDVWLTFLDDAVLGGVHASHTGPDYFNYVMWDASKQKAQPHATLDAWTTVGSDRSGRQMASDYSTDLISRKACQWIATQTAARQFFGYVATRTAHHLPVAAARHAHAKTSAFGAIPLTVPEHRPSFDEADISDKPAWLQAQFPAQFPPAETVLLDQSQKKVWQTVQSLDELLYDLVDTLTSTGLIDTTTMIVANDNGWMNGEHRITNGKCCGYEPSLLSPIWIRHPSLPMGMTVRHDPVSNVDLAATVCDLMGAACGPGDGVSLAPLLDMAAPGPTAHYFSWDHIAPTDPPSFRGVADSASGFKLTDYAGADTAELYDLAADPDEMVNVAGDPAHASTLAAMEALLAQGS